MVDSLCQFMLLVRLSYFCSVQPHRHVEGYKISLLVRVLKVRERPGFCKANYEPVPGDAIRLLLIIKQTIIDGQRGFNYY